MTIEGYLHGQPAWQDHTSDDDAASAEFYSALFGWECPPGDPEFGGYRNCTLNGKTVAGMSPQMAPGGPTVWSTYIKVDDSAAVAQLVTENNGQIMVEPMQVGDYGKMAVFVDPTGAVFGTWEPGTHTGAEVRDEPGSVCWHELVTSDVAGAGAFYAAVLGWTVQAHGPAGGPGGYNEFKIGDKTVGGMMAKPPNMPAGAPSHWSLYFAVDDADATAARIAELGGSVIMGPTDIAPGRFAVAKDPAGAMFNILKSSR